MCQHHCYQLYNKKMHKTQKPLLRGQKPGESFFLTSSPDLSTSSLPRCAGSPHISCPAIQKVIFKTTIIPPSKMSLGNNFGDCPSLTPRFALLTQYQKSYDTKHSIYLESMLMQCYGNYIYAILFSNYQHILLCFQMRQHLLH